MERSDAYVQIVNSHSSIVTSIAFLFDPFNTLENLPCGQGPGEAGDNLELAFLEHLHTHAHVFKKVERSHLKSYDHTDFIHSSTLFDIGQRRIVKGCHLGNRGFDPFPQSGNLHGVHHLCDVHFLWAPGRARLARGAQPHRLAVENKIVHAEADRMDQLGRLVVHRIRNGTTGRTFSALITKVDVLAAFAKDRFGQGRV